MGVIAQVLGHAKFKLDMGNLHGLDSSFVFEAACAAARIVLPVVQQGSCLHDPLTAQTDLLLCAPKLC